MSEPADGYFQLIEPLFDVVDIYNSGSSFEKSCERVPRGLLLIYASHFALSEVHNGGFLQLFWNNTGVLTAEAIQGFRNIGMQDLAAIFARAASLVANPLPRDREARWDALLKASSCSAEELENLFASEKHFYQAYRKATDNLGFEALNDRVFELAAQENGGFSLAATRYLQSSR